MARAFILCLNCQKHRRSYSNGLCLKCHSIPEARKRFPYPYKGTKLPREAEPTMEELDALIAERMKALPKWWHREHEKADAERGFTPCEKTLQNNKCKKGKKKPTKFKSIFENGRNG